MEHHYDAAGNHWITLRGRIGEGAHPRQPSRFGAQRRLARRLPRRDDGLEVLRGFARKYNGRPPVTIRAGRLGRRRRRALRPQPAGLVRIRRHALASTPTAAARTRTAFAWKTLCARCGVEIDRFPEAAARTRERRRLSGTAHRTGSGARNAWACRSESCWAPRASSATRSRSTARKRTPARRR